MSTWETRELPVLRAIEARLAGGTGRPGGVTVAQIAKDVGMAPSEVQGALRILAESHGPYVSGSGLVASEGEPVVTSLTERALTEIRRADAKRSMEGSGEGPGRARQP